ncbi:phage tail assembly chaperone [Mesorhizobium microcysteis]|uniref:Phage tail assembly chaperone n=1 Tax=Neoaquamicrobium microcysteis TaxID=2682781 RepID=A0A5D4H036_9HYPH|nr:phage tail assembly chaperone [Mesorhizobium microcysteis]TYR34371.1 phage tail assembly chaperone [Mesorhizobium microcysteis]
MNAATGTTRQFPWDELIALGLGRLRLSPRDFWATTPRELAHVLRAFGAGQPLRRPVLERLMTMFPDTREGG